MKRFINHISHIKYVKVMILTLCEKTFKYLYGGISFTANYIKKTISNTKRKTVNFGRDVFFVTMILYTGVRLFIYIKLKKLFKET